MTFTRDKRQETLVYLVLWGILFTAPVIALIIHARSSGETFAWHDVLVVWREYAVYFFLFLLHNYLLAPLLVYRQRRALYFSGIAALALVFLAYQCTHQPQGDGHGPHHEMAEGHYPPMDHHPAEHGMPPMESQWGDGPAPDREMPPEGEMVKPDGPHHHKAGTHPPMPIDQHDIMALIVFILMLGMNVGVKLYFKQRRDQKQLAQLEKQSLEQQLEYLRYQINPHFLMNTLNNIHALVDIDSEKAKTTILGLSKIMRFVLYEGSKAVVPLSREVDFLRDYIKLMSLRYTDKVSISVKIPDQMPDSEIPPLIFITFVENAFKHGVSYRQQSFVEVTLDVQPAGLLFTCRNSKIPHTEDQHGGVGLQNVKQRLNLIYGKTFTLDIHDETDSYTVNLKLPLNNKT